MFALILAGALAAAAPVQAATPSKLDDSIQLFVEKSLPRLACNLSVGAPGSILASPQKESPNYEFHWVRDSALIVDAMTRLMPFVRGTDAEKALRAFIADFVAYSARLQDSPTPFGAGEVRFLPDGGVDTSAWPRPQYDGPALRALALIRYQETDRARIAAPLRALLTRVIRRDLDSVAKYHRTAGFDLWEYSTGFHFYTRMVQARALSEGRRFFKEPRRWARAEKNLYRDLENHWSPEWRAIAFNDGPAADADGRPIPTNPLRFDTSVVLAVNHAPFTDAHFSLMDERVWSTLSQLEDYFLTSFPMNADKSLGPAVGRHPGDGYYGGNAFFFLTAGYAEWRFRTASRIASVPGSLRANELRLSTLSQVLQAPVAFGTRYRLPNRRLAEAFAREGDAFLQTMLDAVPADGAIAEQLSKVDGSPASARDLSWSYASILTAILAREQWRPSTVNFRKLNFHCPRELYSDAE